MSMPFLGYLVMVRLNFAMQQAFLAHLGLTGSGSRHMCMPYEL